jgi:DnaJ-like protein
MSDFNAQKDYYEILGANEGATARDLERLYKRRAAQHHPDRGGNEEEMKTLNEAYGVLRNNETRKAYDARRAKPQVAFVPVTAPTAEDVGLLGRGLTSFLCLIIGLFLLVLVRSQWIWFLWPLAILAFLVILFGVVMARGTVRALSFSLPASNPLRRHTHLQEVAFWFVVAGGVYGVYLLLTSL